jgi:CRISPR-associated endonuclease/helicase Cas3
MQSYREFFKKATGFEPFPWQLQMVSSDTVPEIVSVPTGMGKTAGVVLSWLWRRQRSAGDVPRRLVYCFPMRVLVEQTEAVVRNWIRNLELDVDVHVLLGGNVSKNWDRSPEREAILIGTQDMLLSRALNRGYAESRFRWPVQFALLNNDSYWVMDEVQLMGVGLQTSLQMQAFREQLHSFGVGTSTWMSATISEKWLDTVDHPSENLQEIAASAADYQSQTFTLRHSASKQVKEVSSEISLEDLILDEHAPGTLTVVVRNTVSRAVEAYKSLLKKKPDAEILLLHSRFRKPDRDAIISKLFSDTPEAGRILVSTQVVEAGVDISAKALFTDMAPWASMVQRFGRCNRRGEYESSSVFWIRPETKAGFALPYEDEEVTASVAKMEKLENAGLKWLPEFKERLKPQPVIRKKDIIELFDTTPDLAGMDIDVSRFIRSTEGKSVFVFWREINRENPDDQSKPERNELCRVPLAELKRYLKKKNGWVWDHLSGQWKLVKNCAPGATVMLDFAAGGYTPETGWLSSSKKPVKALIVEHNPAESNDDDYETLIGTETIAKHTDLVIEAMEEICRLTGTDLNEDLLNAVRWHDAGKSHWAFQARFGNSEQSDRAKGNWVLDRKQFPRTGFRHELASALAILGNGGSDLSAYLAASHHGKVRLSIRSLPIEEPPKYGERHARGIHEGDILPETKLGNGVVMPETVLKLGYMELGGDENGESWLSRTLRLRKKYGPFRLAFLEALLRIADWRGSERGADGNV